MLSNITVSDSLAAVSRRENKTAKTSGRSSVDDKRDDLIAMRYYLLAFFPFI